MASKPTSDIVVLLRITYLQTHIVCLDSLSSKYLCFSISLFLCLYFSLFLCFSVSMFLCLSVSLSLCLSVSLSLIGKQPMQYHFAMNFVMQKNVLFPILKLIRVQRFSATHLNMFITFPKTEFWIFTRGRFFVKLVVNDSCILLLLHELKIVERKKKSKTKTLS